MDAVKNLKTLRESKFVRYVVVIGVAGIILIVGLVLFFPGKGALVKSKNPAQQQASSQVAQQKVDKHIDITIENGQATPAPQTITVKSGTQLEVSITSDQLGRLGFPSTPPKVIEFTQKTMTLNFTAHDPGTYPLTYQAPDQTNAATIATLIISK